jgi:hypothetical protein
MCRHTVQNNAPLPVGKKEENSKAD